MLRLIGWWTVIRLLDPEGGGGIYSFDKSVGLLDIGQNVLKSSLQAGSSSRPSFFPNVLPFTFLEEVFIINTIIIKKVKWYRYRPGLAQKVGTGIALLFHDRGTTTGWGVSSTPRSHFTSGKDTVPILQEARWAPGQVKLHYALILQWIIICINSAIINSNYGRLQVHILLFKISVGTWISSKFVDNLGMRPQKVRQLRPTP